MIEAISNLVLVALAIGLTAMWIHGVSNSDGECHYDNCDYCPYTGNCPWERRV